MQIFQSDSFLQKKDALTLTRLHTFLDKFISFKILVCSTISFSIYRITYSIFQKQSFLFSFLSSSSVVSKLDVMRTCRCATKFLLIFHDFPYKTAAKFRKYCSSQKSWETLEIFVISTKIQRNVNEVAKKYKKSCQK